MTSRLRVITGATSLGCLVVLLAAAVLTGAQWEDVLVAGGLAALVLSVGLVAANAMVVVAAIGLVAAVYLVRLLVEVPAPGTTLGAIIAGSTLLLISEFAFWSLSLRSSRLVSADTARRRIMAIVALLAVTVTASTAAALASQAPLPGSAGLLVVGAGAYVVILGMIAGMVWRRGTEPATGTGDAPLLPPNDS